MPLQSFRVFAGVRAKQLEKSQDKSGFLLYSCKGGRDGPIGSKGGQLGEGCACKRMGPLPEAREGASHLLFPCNFTHKQVRSFRTIIKIFDVWFTGTGVFCRKNVKSAIKQASFHFFSPFMQAPNSLVDLELFLLSVLVVSSSCTILFVFDIEWSNPVYLFGCNVKSD